MKRKLLLSFAIALSLYFLLGKRALNDQEIHESSMVQSSEQGLDSLSKEDKKKAMTIAEDMHDNHSHDKMYSVNNENLKIEDFIIELEDSDHTLALETTLRMIKQVNLNEFDLTGTALELKDLGLAPKITTNENPDTGTMKVLRSQNSIPGLRYFHAQIFNDNGKDFIQHVSFEYRPGEKSFKEVITSLIKTYQLTKAPEVLSANFVMWKIDDSHILWAKKLGKEELINDPIYPHDESDIGTIKVAIEQEIH